MKKLVSTMLIFVLSFSMIACNSNADSTKDMNPIEIYQTYGESSKEVKELNKKNSKLTKEQVLKNVEDSMDEIKSLQGKYTIDVAKLKDGKRLEDESIKTNLLSKSIYSGESEDKVNLTEIYAELDQQMNGENKVHNATYVNIEKNRGFFDNGSGMKEYKIGDDGEMQVNNDSEYKNTVKMMIMASKFMDFSEDDDNYYLTFTGKNGDLLYMIDGLFGLGIELMELDKIDIDVKYTIRKADFQVSEVYHKAVQNYKGEDFESIGTFKLDSINAFDTIEEIADLIKDNEDNKNQEENKKAA